MYEHVQTSPLRNTNAETAPYIQDALVAKVYTSAMAALVQAGACQVSAHISAWVTGQACESGHASSNDTVPSIKIRQCMPIGPRPRYTPLPCNGYAHVC